MGAQELRTKPRRRWQEIGTAYVMLLPSLIGVGLFLIVPFFLVFAISLTDWNLINPPSFIGIANYEYIFSGSDSAIHFSSPWSSRSWHYQRRLFSGFSSP